MGVVRSIRGSMRAGHASLHRRPGPGVRPDALRRHQPDDHSIVRSAFAPAVVQERSGAGLASGTARPMMRLRGRRTRAVAARRRAPQPGRGSHRRGRPVGRLGELGAARVATAPPAISCTHEQRHRRHCELLSRCPRPGEARVVMTPGRNQGVASRRRQSRPPGLLAAFLRGAGPPRCRRASGGARDMGRRRRARGLRRHGHGAPDIESLQQEFEASLDEPLSSARSPTPRLSFTNGASSLYTSCDVRAANGPAYCTPSPWHRGGRRGCPRRSRHDRRRSRARPIRPQRPGRPPHRRHARGCDPARRAARRHLDGTWPPARKIRVTQRCQRVTLPTSP